MGQFLWAPIHSSIHLLWKWWVHSKAALQLLAKQITQTVGGSISFTSTTDDCMLSSILIFFRLVSHKIFNLRCLYISFYSYLLFIIFFTWYATVQIIDIKVTIAKIVNIISPVCINWLLANDNCFSFNKL